MKQLIVFALSVFLSVALTAQTWHSYYYTDYGFTQLTSTDWTGGGRHFKINHLDNSLWFARLNRIQRITGTGQREVHNFSTSPALYLYADFQDFGFSENTTYVMDANYGLFRYDGMNWQSLLSASDCEELHVDSDTVWFTRTTEDVIKWVNGTYETIPVSLRRIIAKDGVVWGSGTGIGGAGFHRIEESTYINYTPGNSLIMDNYNYDFKFSPHTDTMYVAGQKGLSLLHDLVFFDSIAPDNSTNMPMGVILDFEFDASDNIWALFGTGANDPYAIAHYDQATENWDAYYDDSNSPINFSYYTSIEMDTFGNLWVANYYNLYLLELGEVPFWLSTPEVAGLEAVSLYPNPSSDKVHILADAAKVKRMVLRDITGRVVYDAVFSEEFSVSGFSPGTYVIELKGDNDRLLESRKLVVQ